MYGSSELSSHVAFDLVALDFYGQHSDDDFDLPTETEGRGFGAVVRIPDEVRIISALNHSSSPSFLCFVICESSY
jgi:hypothetical protein